VFDSDADVAAVVYGPGDDPDRLQREFADDLQRFGYRVVGPVQSGRRRRGVQERLPAVALPTRATGSLRRSCQLAWTTLSEERLAATRASITTATDESADLVIIKRFGPLEAAGAGFVDEIDRAVAADIPVLIAVPHQRFGTWIRFCAGMAVKLPCSREPIDAWWRTVSRQRNGRPPGTFATFCEMMK
jgi:nucleoside-triphosphatase THEP1